MAAETVSGGMLFFYGIGARGLTIHTPSLTAVFNLADTGSFPFPGSPHQPGSVVDISGNLIGEQTLSYGPGYFDGIAFTRLWYEGSLRFQAEPLVVPFDASPPDSISTSFTLEGTLRAHLTNKFSRDASAPLFDVTLTGKGVATAHFGPEYAGSNGPLRNIFERAYAFTNS